MLRVLNARELGERKLKEGSLRDHHKDLRLRALEKLGPDEQTYYISISWAPVRATKVVNGKVKPAL